MLQAQLQSKNNLDGQQQDQNIDQGLAYAAGEPVDVEIEAVPRVGQAVDPYVFHGNAVGQVGDCATYPEAYHEHREYHDDSAEPLVH